MQLRFLAAAMPALQQVRRIQLLLLLSRLFLLVSAALTRPQALEDFALAISLMIFADRFLAHPFEPAKISPQFALYAQQIFAQGQSELEFGGRAPASPPLGLRPIGGAEVALQLRHCVLGAGHLEICLLQNENSLPLKASPETEQRIESKTERHDFKSSGTPC